MNVTQTMRTFKRKCHAHLLERYIYVDDVQSILRPGSNSDLFQHSKEGTSRDDSHALDSWQKC